MSSKNTNPGLATYPVYPISTEKGKGCAGCTSQVCKTVWNTMINYASTCNHRTNEIFLRWLENQAVDMDRYSQQIGIMLMGISLFVKQDETSEERLQFLEFLLGQGKSMSELAPWTVDIFRQEREFQDWLHRIQPKQ